MWQNLQATLNISTGSEDFVQAGNAIPPYEERRKIIFCYFTDTNTYACRDDLNADDWKLLPT